MDCNNPLVNESLNFVETEDERYVAVTSDVDFKLNHENWNDITVNIHGWTGQVILENKKGQSITVEVDPDGKFILILENVEPRKE